MKLLNKIKNYHPNKYILNIFLFTPIIVFSLSRNLGLDNDRWFILNTGRYILNHGIPHIEPFTLHKGLSYISQQWMSSIVFYLTYDVFGNIGLVFLVVVTIVITELLFYKLCNLLNNNKKSLSIFLTVVFSILYTYYFATTRPQIFDNIIFLFELYILEKYIKTNNKKLLYFLPLLSLLLINIHASVYFMFIAFLLPYILKFKIKYFENEEYKVKPIIIISIICLVASLINPYFTDAHKYIFRSFNIPEINSFVSEMKTPFSFKVSLASLNIIIPVIIPIFIVIFNKKNMKLRYFFLYLGCTYLTVYHCKGFQYYLLAAIFPLADYLKDYFLVTKKIKLTNKSRMLYYLIIFIFLLESTAIVYQSYSVDSSKPQIYKVTNKLNEITKSKDKQTLKLYTDYNNGGYVEWMGYKCYMDPRAEVFLKTNNKKENIFLEYYKLEGGVLNYEKFINKYDFDYIIVSNHSPFYISYLNTKNNTQYTYIIKESNKKYTYYLYEKKSN